MLNPKLVRVLASFLILFNLVAGSAGTALARTTAQATDLALLAVDLPNPVENIPAFIATGLPAYAQLDGPQGAYLLAGAAPADFARLESAGLTYQVLDKSTAGASYYQASTLPGKDAPDWASSGTVLLEQGDQVILRMQPEAAARLSKAGAAVRQISLTAKPLQAPQQTLAIPDEVIPNPLVQAMIDQVTTEQIYHYLRGFAGEEPVWVDGSWYTITTRETSSGTPILKAAHYLGESYAAAGLDVEYHVWNGGHGPNTIGEYTGLVNPEKIYIIGGHLDDVSGTPGADDNASGPIAGLIAAEILSQFQWGCTLRFVGWTGEEWGLLGSEAYAQRSWQQQEEIVVYLNLDMIAWNTPNSANEIYLAYNSSMPPTLALAQLFADVVDAYNIDLAPQLGTSMSGGSDHSSFWQYGYTSILGIEGYNDFNPYYHGPQDTVAHTDPEYFTNYVKAALATFVHLTETDDCLIPTGIGALDGHVTEAGSGNPIENALVEVSDDAGHHFEVQTNAQGYYTRTLIAGTYDVTASLYGYLTETALDVAVVTDTITTVDFALEAAPRHTVSGYVREAVTNLPLAATVQFLDAPEPPVSTDPATGFYSLEVSEGTWNLEASAADHAPQTVTVNVTGDLQQDFSLSPYCDVFSDNMENGVNGWTTGGSPNTWAQVTSQSHSPTHSWTDSPSGNYGNYADNWVRSPAIDLTGYTGTSLTFWHRYATEQNYDYGRVEYSADGGSTWNEVATFDGTQNSWTMEEIALPGLDGVANALIRFHFTSDVSLTDDGWYVDDVTLNAGGIGCIPATPPTAEFTSNSPVTLGAPVNFTNQTSGTPPLDYLWDFGDGTGTSTDENPSYTYAAPGTYTVTLTATNAQGSDDVEHPVEVLPCDPPTGALFTWTPLEPLNGEEVTFNASVGAGTEPITFDWDFGDGATGSGATTTHTYAEPGDYPVILSAANSCGADVISATLTVVPPPPEIEVSPLSFSATLLLGEVATQTLTIANTGPGPLDYTLTDKAGWLSTNPTGGTVPAGEQQAVEVVLSAVGLPPNVYTTDLTVASNDPDEPEITIPVTLTVPVPPNEVTFIYHDLEDVVLPGEEVWLIGCFTSGTTYPVTMTHDAAYDVFTATVFLANRTYNYSYYVPSMGEPLAFDLLNSTDRTVAVSTTLTVEDFRNVLVSWAHLQDPTLITITLGQSTGPLTGEVGIPSVTDGTGEGRGIAAQLGWGTGDDPAAWTWVDMDYTGDQALEDLFAGAFTPAETGVYTFGIRFDGNFAAGNPNRAWTSGDRTGQVVVVEPEPAPDIAVEPLDLSVTLGVSQTQVVNGEIANAGVLTLTFSISETAGWLSVSPLTGTLVPADSLPLVFTFDSTGLPLGEYTTTVLVDSNDPDEPQVAIEVTLTVAEFKAYLPTIFTAFQLP